MGNRQTSLETIERLYGMAAIPPYRDLMRDYRADFLTAITWLRTPEIIAMVVDIKRRALTSSLKDFNENRHQYKDSAKEYHYLFYIATKLYPEVNRKTSWQQALEVADKTQPRRFRRDLSLKIFLEELKQIGTNPEDFHYKRIVKSDSGLVRYAERHFGGFAKVVILNGIDYKTAPFTREKDCVFTQEDIQRVMRDSSLDVNERVRAVFHALSLQYYPLEQFPCFHSKSIDQITEKFQPVYSKTFSECLDSVILQRINREDMFKFRIDYYGKIHGRFSRTDFNFKGGSAVYDCERFCDRVEILLGLT